MPADSDYSEILERLADSHQERLANALKTLEDNVASLMSAAPIKDGKLFDLEWAVAARPEIRAALEADYLSQVDAAIRDYAKVSADASKMLSNYGNFTKLDSTVISQLQRLSFQGFESIANEYLDVMANEVYQSTLTGRSFKDTVKNLRQTINGVYIQSDSVEANKLVDIAANGTAAQQADAVKQLQTIYARDRVGNNLRRYSTQMAQDSLMQFDASINTAIGKQSGATKWKYYGSTVRDSRPFCVEHANQLFTDEEITDTWAGSWKGKASGDPFIVRGGYNCRHHWRPVLDLENDKIEEAKAVAKEQALVLQPNVPVLVAKQKVISSLASRTAKANKKPDFDGSGNTDYNGKSLEGYQLQNGKFASRFRHGTNAQINKSDAFSVPQYARIVFNKNNVTGLTAETLSILDSSLKETDKFARIFGVPKIRSINKSSKGANADMGDSVLGLNSDSFNNWSKSAYTSRAVLKQSALELEDKAVASLAKRKELRAEYDDLFERYNAASASDKALLVPEVRAAATALNKEIDKFNRLAKKEQKARALANLEIPNTFVKGDDLNTRPFSVKEFFSNGADKARSVIYHEFGHNIHQQYKTVAENFLNPPLEKWLKMKFKQKPFFPSRYSEVNPNEWFAENFSLYKMGRLDLMDTDLLELMQAIEKSNGTLSEWKGFNLATGEII